MPLIVCILCAITFAIRTTTIMKVIQVGIGGMGNAWLNAVLNSSEVTFAGFVEVNDAIIEAQAVRYNMDRSRIFKSLGDAIKKIHADAVINVTPPQFDKD